MEDPVSHLRPVSEDTAETDEATGASGVERNRSTIAFPYNGLADAELIAKTLHESYGGSATQDQLAGSLQTTPRSGTFRNKMGAARIFGVVSVSQGKVKLTSLGDRLVDPKSRRLALVEAFMTVPLYKAIYDEYEGRAIPPDEGLEQKIAELGVSPKQTGKARQAMNSSAKLAGFFDIDRTRLIRTNISPDSSAEDLKGDEPEKTKTVNPVNTDASVPLGELWVRLLNEGGDWSATKTQEFVTKAREMRDLLERDS